MPVQDHSMAACRWYVARYKNGPAVVGSDGENALTMLASVDAVKLIKSRGARDFRFQILVDCLAPGCHSFLFVRPVVLSQDPSKRGSCDED